MKKKTEIEVQIVLISRNSVIETMPIPLIFMIF